MESRNSVDVVKGLFTKQSIKKNQKNLALWTAFFTIILFVYHAFSDGDFSFLMTFGSACITFAFGVLVYKIWSQKTVAGISLKTLELYGIVYVCRLFSILRFQGYLPYDRSGDWFYQLLEVLSLVLCAVSIFLVTVKFKDSYEKRNDSFGNLHVPSEFGIVWLAVPCVVLAIIFHPHLNENFLADTAWTIAQYVESVAIIPQLYMFQKQGGGTVESLISHWIYALGFGRLLHMWFWMSSFWELSDRSSGNVVGFLVILTQLLHMLLMGDFFYYYFKSMKEGGPMTLPMTRV